MFYGKNQISGVNLIHFFYCGTVSGETGEKIAACFTFFLAQKWNCLMISWVKSGIKLWNRQIWSGKKMKLTARGFAAAVSFIFFSTESGRCHNFSHFNSWNHRQFYFWAKKNVKTSSHFSPVSRETCHKKKMRFLPKTRLFLVWQKCYPPNACDLQLIGVCYIYIFF